MHRCLFGKSEAEVDDSHISKATTTGTGTGTGSAIGICSEKSMVKTEMNTGMEVEAGYGSWLVGLVGNVAGALAAPAAGFIGRAAGVDSREEEVVVGGEEEEEKEEEHVVAGPGFDLSSGHQDGPLVRSILATLRCGCGSGDGSAQTHVLSQPDIQAQAQGSVSVAVVAAAVAAGMDMLAASARERAVLAVRLCERAPASATPTSMSTSTSTSTAASNLLLLLYKRLSDVLVADGAYAAAQQTLEHCRTLETVLAAAQEPESESEEPMGSTAGTILRTCPPERWAAVDVPEGSRMFAHVFATADTDVCGVQLPCLAVHVSNGTIVTPDSPLSAPVAQAALGLGAAERALAFKRRRFGLGSE
jgi:hypothetical protein